MTKLSLIEFLTLDAAMEKIESSEQPSPALDVVDRGLAVGRTPAGLNKPSQASTVGILPCSNREGFYTNESHKMYDGDISKLMGCLA